MNDALIIIIPSTIIMVLLVVLLFSILWRNIVEVLALTGIVFFGLAAYHGEYISYSYGLPALICIILALTFRQIRKAKPITPKRLYAMCASATEVKTDSDQALLMRLCEEAMIDPTFRDYWGAADYNQGKRATDRQYEMIRQLGYTGKLPKNMRAASALIEVLKIIKLYNAERYERSTRSVARDVPTIEPRRFHVKTKEVKRVGKRVGN